MHIHHIRFLHIVVNTRFYIYILSLLFRSPQLIVCLNVLPTLPVHHTYPCTSQCIMQDVLFWFFLSENQTRCAYSAAVSLEQRRRFGEFTSHLIILPKMLLFPHSYSDFWDVCFFCLFLSFFFFFLESEPLQRHSRLLMASLRNSKIKDRRNVSVSHKIVSKTTRPW